MARLARQLDSSISPAPSSGIRSKGPSRVRTVSGQWYSNAESNSLPVPAVDWGRLSRGSPHQTLANDFDHAVRTGRYRHPEAVQLDDGIHQAQSKTYAVRPATVVRTVKPPSNEVTLTSTDAGSAVTDAYRAFAPTMGQCEFDESVLRSKLYGVVDQVSDRLEQQVTIAAHDRLDIRRHFESDPLVLRDRLV